MEDLFLCFNRFTETRVTAKESLPFRIYARIFSYNILLFPGKVNMGRVELIFLVMCLIIAFLHERFASCCLRVNLNAINNL